MKFEIVGKDFVIDGKPTKIVSGAVHYFRNMPDTWDDIFAKLMALGCNCVETYCVFQKAEPETEEEEDEVVIFALQGEEDDAVLMPLEDEQLLDEVFAEFCHQYEKFENADEAMELE